MPLASKSSATSPAFMLSVSVPPPGVAAIPLPAARLWPATRLTVTFVPSAVAVTANAPGESGRWRPADS